MQRQALWKQHSHCLSRFSAETSGATCTRGLEMHRLQPFLSFHPVVFFHTHSCSRQNLRGATLKSLTSVPLLAGMRSFIHTVAFLSLSRASMHYRSVTHQILMGHLELYKTAVLDVHLDSSLIFHWLFYVNILYFPLFWLRRHQSQDLYIISPHLFFREKFMKFSNNYQFKHTLEWKYNNGLALTDN